MDVLDAGCFHGRFFFRHALLGGKPEADDRGEPLLLQVRHAVGVSGASARKHGVDLIEVGHARHFNLLDLSKHRRCKHRDGKRRHQTVGTHAVSPSGGDITSVSGWWLTVSGGSGWWLVPVVRGW